MPQSRAFIGILQGRNGQGRIGILSLGLDSLNNVSGLWAIGTVPSCLECGPGLFQSKENLGLVNLVVRGVGSDWLVFISKVHSQGDYCCQQAVPPGSRSQKREKYSWRTTLLAVLIVTIYMLSAKMIEIKEAVCDSTVEGELESEKVAIGKPIRKFLWYLQHK